MHRHVVGCMSAQLVASPIGIREMRFHLFSASDMLSFTIQAFLASLTSCLKMGLFSLSEFSLFCLINNSFSLSKLVIVASLDLDFTLEHMVWWF